MIPHFPIDNIKNRPAPKIAGVVIPCYNECGRLPFKAFKEYIFQNSNFHFCFVNDGSTDETLGMLNELRSYNYDNISVVNLSVNSGKAEAVRQGILHLFGNFECEYFCFIDADLAAPLHELSRLLEISQTQNLSMTFGSRVAVYGTNIKRIALRHYTGRIFATFASIILKEAIYDTQCGLKVIKGDLVVPIFGERFITKWVFDVEIFARVLHHLRDRDLKKLIKEIPLNDWIERGGSKIRFKDLFAIPFALCRISYSYSRKTATRRFAPASTRPYLDMLPKSVEL